MQANLKRYRASVLKAACEGKLVPTEAELAQAEGRDYERGDQLLERILSERRARWASQEKRRGKDKDPVSPDTSDLPELPEGWVWSKIGESFDVFVGATPRRSRPDYWGGDKAWVSSSEVAFTRIKKTRERITDEGLKNSSTDGTPSGHSLVRSMIGDGQNSGSSIDLGYSSLQQPELSSNQGLAIEAAA